MKNIKWIYTALMTLTLCLFNQSVFSAEINPALSPIGDWKTIDDVTGQAKSIVQISADNSRHLNGRVIKIIPHKGANEHELCHTCSGAKKNQPILGMTILWGLKQNNERPTEWAEGSILDPKSGKIYHCSINVIDNGNKLRVRGYFGIPILGRTQNWIRVNGE